MAEKRLGFLSRAVWGSLEVHRLISFALIVSAPVISVVLSKTNNGWWITLLVLLQLVVAATTWFIGDARARTLQEERLASRGETLLDLGHTLEPLTREIGRVSTLNTPERRKQNSGLRNAILGAATGLNDSALRACYFKLERLAAGPQRLVHVYSTGRSIQPKSEFIAGTPAGDAALLMVDQGEFLFCDDVLAKPPPGWVPSQQGEYRTFISVTVGTPGRPVGMLTLDAPDVGALSAEDVRMCIVLGHLLGIIEVLTE